MFTIPWRYQVRSRCDAEFVAGYGSEGTWVRFFRSGGTTPAGDGYLGTELWRDAENVNVYLTIDRWESAGHYERFTQDNAEEYRRIDATFDPLTVSETRITEGRT